eukprot:308148-Amphidinium_carterae.4
MLKQQTLKHVCLGDSRVCSSMDVYGIEEFLACSSMDVFGLKTCCSSMDVYGIENLLLKHGCLRD